MILQTNEINETINNYKCLQWAILYSLLKKYTRHQSNGFKDLL